MADDGYKVTTDTLRTEAGIWDQQSEQLGKIATSVQSMTMDRFQAGVFQLVVGAYAEVLTAVHDRSLEGQKNLKAVGDGLRKVADNYDHHEQKTSADIAAIAGK
ncbi:hypothetical protein [Kitasatospora sp. NPDC101183]|uniref:hypothetical protein n=1 Tax=Kitasatospora sp. NPDC101183 TaxID=3364100 RepID=UPI00380998AC